MKRSEFVARLQERKVCWAVTEACGEINITNFKHELWRKGGAIVWFYNDNLHIGIHEVANFIGDTLDP